MKSLRAALLGLSLALPAALASAPAFAEETPGATKIAIIDFRRAVLDTEDGLRAQSNLKKLADQQQTELALKQRAIDEERAKLEKEVPAARDSKDKAKLEKLEKRAQDWQKKALEFDEQKHQVGLKLQKAEQEQTGHIVKKVQELLQKLARSEGYDVILDKAVAHYVKGNLDLTDKVIQMYNQTGGAKPAVPAPAAPEPLKKPDAKADPKAEPKVEPKAEPKADPKAEPNPIKSPIKKLP